MLSQILPPYISDHPLLKKDLEKSLGIEDLNVYADPENSIAYITVFGKDKEKAL